MIFLKCFFKKTKKNWQNEKAMVKYEKRNTRYS